MIIRNFADVLARENNFFKNYLYDIGKKDFEVSPSESENFCGNLTFSVNRTISSCFFDDASGFNFVLKGTGPTGFNRKTSQKFFDWVNAQLIFLSNPYNNVRTRKNRRKHN